MLSNIKNTESIDTIVGKADSIINSHDASSASNYFIGPDTIFLGGIAGLNANIFKNVNNNETTIFKKIVNVVARFYVILRNIAGLIMLAGLIYTGIRILLSANIPTKKTQYLMLLQDWILGMLLLIFSHILMIVIMDISEALTNALGSSMSGTGSMKLELIQHLTISFDSSTQLISLILYIYITFLTITFAIAYFKRFFWTCILTVFAPVFSVMYAFGQQTKQIYSNWLKEYIMNAMIQPFHIIVYTVLVGIPMNLTSDWTWSGQNTTNFIYALIAMSMIRPAEKYLRNMFGMNKGVANMASYDSGKQVIDGAVKAVASVAKAAVAVGATVATAGAAAGAIGATDSATGGIKEAIDSAEKVDDAVEKAEDNKLIPEGNKPQWEIEDWEKQDGRYFNPYKEEWFTEEELNAGRDLPAYMDQDNSDEDKIIKGIEQSIGNNKEQQNALNAANITINASSVNMNGKLETAQNGEIKATESNNDTNNDNNNDNNNGNNGNTPSIDKTKDNDDISLEAPPSFFETFKNLGGLEQIGDLGAELYKGVHSLTDGLYVDGQAPTSEWKGNAQWIEGNIKGKREKRKEEVEREKDNWAHNKDNISIMTDKYYNEKYLPEMQKRYGNSKSQDYIKSLAREKAEEKAKSALKDMSVYVEYGITDVNTAYKLYDNANNNGYSPEQSIRNLDGYTKFNSNVQNVTQINSSGAYKNNNYTTVEAAIPAAKQYYDAGYTNLNDMAWVDKIASALGKDPSFAMKVDQTLKRKGGKINYNGKDAAMKDVIKQINEHYGG